MSYGLNVKETIKQYDFKNIHFLVDLDQTSYNEYTILDFDYLKDFGLPFQLIFQKVPNKLKEYYSVFGDNILCNYSVFFRDTLDGHFIYYNGHEYKCEHKENSTYEVKALGAIIDEYHRKMYMNGIEYSFDYFQLMENNAVIYYATNIKKINEEIQLVYFNRWDNIFDYCITFKSKKFGKDKVEIHIYDANIDNKIYFEFTKNDKIIKLVIASYEKYEGKKVINSFRVYADGSETQLEEAYTINESGLRFKNKNDQQEITVNYNGDKISKITSIGLSDSFTFMNNNRSRITNNFNNVHQDYWINSNYLMVYNSFKKAFQSILLDPVTLKPISTSKVIYENLKKTADVEQIIDLTGNITKEIDASLPVNIDNDKTVSVTNLTADKLINNCKIKLKCNSFDYNGRTIVLFFKSNISFNNMHISLYDENNQITKEYDLHKKSVSIKCENDYYMLAHDIINEKKISYFIVTYNFSNNTSNSNILIKYLPIVFKAHLANHYIYDEKGLIRDAIVDGKIKNYTYNANQQLISSPQTINSYSEDGDLLS